MRHFLVLTLAATTMISNGCIANEKSKQTDSDDEILQLGDRYGVSPENVIIQNIPTVSIDEADLVRTKVSICKANYGNNASSTTLCDQVLPEVCKTAINNINAHSGVYSIHYALSHYVNTGQQNDINPYEELKWRNLDFEENIRLIREAASRVSELGMLRKEYAINQNYDRITELYHSSKYIKLQELKPLNKKPCDKDTEERCIPIYRLVYERPNLSTRKTDYYLNGSPVVLQAVYFFDPSDLSLENEPKTIGMMASDIIKYKDELFVQKYDPSNKNQSFIYKLNQLYAYEYGMTTTPVCSIIRQ